LYVHIAFCRVRVLHNYMTVFCCCCRGAVVVVVAAVAAAVVSPLHGQPNAVFQSKKAARLSVRKISCRFTQHTMVSVRGKMPIFKTNYDSQAGCFIFKGCELKTYQFYGRLHTSLYLSPIQNNTHFRPKIDTDGDKPIISLRLL